MKSTNRFRIVHGMAAIAICTFAAGSVARAQSPDVSVDTHVAPSTNGSYVESANGVEFVEDTSPYLARGTMKGCEFSDCDEGPHSCCCLINWLTYPFCCGDDGKASACPWHHWCPRGHCRVKPTGCTRIDYARHVLKGREYKKSTEAAESTAKVDPVGISIYNVYKPRCQNFWLHDGRLEPCDECAECGSY